MLSCFLVNKTKYPTHGLFIKFSVCWLTTCSGKMFVSNSEEAWLPLLSKLTEMWNVKIIERIIYFNLNVFNTCPVGQKFTYTEPPCSHTHLEDPCVTKLPSWAVSHCLAPGVYTFIVCTGKHGTFRHLENTPKDKLEMWRPTIFFYYLDLFWFSHDVKKKGTEFEGWF